MPLVDGIMGYKTSPQRTQKWGRDQIIPNLLDSAPSRAPLAWLHVRLCGAKYGRGFGCDCCRKMGRERSVMSQVLGGGGGVAERPGADRQVTSLASHRKEFESEP